MSQYSIPVVGVGEVRNFSVSFAELLDSGETVAEITSLTEVGTSDLTLSHIRINTTSVPVGGIMHAPGQVLHFRVSGMKEGLYKLRCVFQTSSTPPQTLVRTIQFRAVTP
jgi:hypothetical protein